MTVPDIVRRRLAPAMPNDRVFAWIGTFVITGIALVVRLIGLAHPQPPSTQDKIFDEIYYATEGHDLLTHGVEWNTTWNSGDFVVHPPLGKWIIGFGEWIFKYDTFGWRIMPALFGTAAIFLIIRIARRMFRSTILGLAAGALMAADGMEFVLSRTALLDIFLMFFVLAAFGCFVLDRDSRRLRWLRALESGLDPTLPGKAGRPGGTFWQRVPWWRMLGAVLTGCAMAVKWSAVWYVILFAILIFAWEAGARRSAGVPHWIRDAFLDEVGWVLLAGVLAMVIYTATWTGWFLSTEGYDRNWYALHHDGHTLPWGINGLYNLYRYHSDALSFHDGLTTPHPYQSWPWQWLLLGRPVAFYYSSSGPCGAANCSSEVLLLGTPILWWSFLPAIIGATAIGIARRDWRGITLFGGAFMGIVPWTYWEIKDHRTMFYFYAAPALPFLVMAVVYLFGMLINTTDRASAGQTFAVRPASGYILGIRRRTFGAVLLGAYVLIVIGCFIYFYPIYVGAKIPYNDWLARMWLGSRWI